MPWVLLRWVKDFDSGLKPILMDSIDTPELEVSFDEADVMPSSVSSGYLCLVSTHYDNSRLQLAPNIKCYTLWCQAKSLLLPVPQVGKISASKLIYHFSCHPAVFGFQDSLPPDSITLICLLLRLHRVQWLIQLLTYGILFSYQGCSCWYYHLSTMFWWRSYYNLRSAWITRIHDILDSAVSKQVGDKLVFSISFYFCFQAVLWNLGFTVSLFS